MSRKRYITSAMGADERIERIAESDQLSAMMWPWLLTAFDDWGRLDVTSVGKIRLEIFPAFQNIKNADISKAVEAFVAAGMVHRYAHGDRTYLAIRPSKWMKWQKYLKGTKRASTEAPLPPSADVPWPREEESTLTGWLTRADERSQTRTAPNVGGCLPTNADSCRHSELAVPNPIPSPLKEREREHAPTREGSPAPDGGGPDGSEGEPPWDAVPGSPDGVCPPNDSATSRNASSYDPAYSQPNGVPDPTRDPNLARIVAAYEEHIGGVYSQRDMDYLCEWSESFRPEIVLHAIREAASPSVRAKTRYIDTTLRKLHDAGVKTPEDLAAYTAPRTGGARDRPHAAPPTAGAFRRLGAELAAEIEGKEAAGI